MRVQVRFGVPCSRFPVRRSTPQFPRTLRLINIARNAYIDPSRLETGLILIGTPTAFDLSMAPGAKRFNELRAWQACNTYKLAIYRMCAEGPLSRDWERRRQLEESVAGPPAHIAEGFGRVNPTEFERFTVIARASLMESRDHLRNAVDKQYITDAIRRELDGVAEEALREVAELIDSLQRDSSRLFPRARSSHPDSCGDTADGSPRRNRTAARR